MRAVPLISSFVILLTTVAYALVPTPLLEQSGEGPTALVKMSDEEVSKAAVSMPKPEYPMEARRRRIGGTGVYDCR